MADKKIIAVVGATGAQGGGLVRAILADPKGGFAARAVTRNPGADKAKALAAAGAEVVAADLDDRASLERAFKGAYGAFCLTNFWEHFSAEKEVAQAENMARAAKAAGVRHVDLVHPGRHQTLGAALGRPDAHPARQVQSAAFRRKGRGRREVPGAGRAHHVPADLLLLGELHLLRVGPQARSGRQARPDVPAG